MNAHVNRNYASKTVNVINFTGFSDREIVEFAFKVAGETPGNFDNPEANVGGFGSSFGYSISRGEHTAIVTIKTD